MRFFSAGAATGLSRRSKLLHKFFLWASNIWQRLLLCLKIMQCSIFYLMHGSILLNSLFLWTFNIWQLRLLFFLNFRTSLTKKTYIISIFPHKRKRKTLLTTPRHVTRLFATVYWIWPSVLMQCFNNIDRNRFNVGVHVDQKVWDNRNKTEQSDNQMLCRLVCGVQCCSITVYVCVYECVHACVFFLFQHSQRLIAQQYVAPQYISHFSSK